MIPAAIGAAAISSGANLLGGLLNRDAQKEANQANSAMALANIEAQKDFAQHGISWKVDDAKNAGIHPLYALGASTSSFSPVSVGHVPETGLGDAMGRMGQDISRAVAAPMSQGARVSATMQAQQSASNALDLETKQLNNQILRAKLATMTQPGTPPGVPFITPEKTKPEENPMLNIGWGNSGYRWSPDPHTAPMKAWEDRYGDEGPVAWTMPLYIAGRDAMHNWKKSNEDWYAQPDNIRRMRELDKAWDYFNAGSVSPRRPRPRGYY